MYKKIPRRENSSLLRLGAHSEPYRFRTWCSRLEASGLLEECK